MSSRAPLILLAAAALAAVAWLFFSEDEQGIEPLRSHPAESVQQEAPEAGADPVLELAATGGEEEEPAQREAAEPESADGHTILVLAPDGSPAVDVAVAHWVIPEERMDELRAYYTEQTDQVGGIMNDDNLPRTDATGRVTLPTRATCSAWVTEWERAGMVFVEAALEGEPTEHVLSLRAYPMIEVRIVEADGTVPNLNPRLDVHVADTQAAAQLPGDASAWERDQVWPYTRRNVFPLPDGRRAFIPEPTAQDRQRLSDPPGPFLFQMRLELPQRGFEESVEFDQTRREPIEFVLPANGELAIQVLGGPQGVEPTIAMLDDEGEPQSLSQAVRQEGDFFIFEKVAVDAQFQVGLLMRPQERGGAYLTDDHLGVVPGPTAAGGRVEHSVRYQSRPGIIGRFTAPEGFDFRSNCIDLGRGQTWLLLDGDQRRADRPRCTVYPDGSFWIESARLEPQNMRAEDVSGVEHTALLPASEEAGRAETIRVRAQFDARLESYESVTDVGEVPLEFIGPFFQLRVVDADGQPVAGARVEAMVGLARDLREDGVRTYQSWGGRPKMTDEQGGITLYATDWSEFFGLHGRFKESTPQTEVVSVRMDVSHHKFIVARVAFDPSLRELEVVLERAASIVGSLKHMPGVPIVYAVAVRPGEAMDTYHQTGIQRSQIDFRSKPTPQLQEIDLRAVPPGSWDVVFRLSSGLGEEIYRVPGVRTVQGEVTRDPRLQEVSLADRVGLIRLAMREAGGGPLTVADRERFDPQLISRLPRGVSSVQLTWDEGEIVLPVPQGETLRLDLYAEGWLTKQLGELGPGRHEVTMRPSPKITLRLRGTDRVPAEAIYSLRIAAEDQLHGSLRLRSQDGPAFEVRLPAEGPLSLSWTVHLNGTSIVVDRGTLEVDAASLSEGQELVIDLPDKLVEALQQ
ncbi:MAG: hypothetical protein CMJ94_11985 [Planctomycetes bacterium]|nr:hypothetical protein [Planctomycetota bacterium]